MMSKMMAEVIGSTSSYWPVLGRFFNDFNRLKDYRVIGSIVEKRRGGSAEMSQYNI
jgi:hypothetical protein